MMKEKKVWIVIGCILVLGSTVTGYTHSYIKKQPDFYETGAVLSARQSVGQEKQRAGDQAIEEEAVPAPAALEADAGVPAAASFGAPEADEGLAQCILVLGSTVTGYTHSYIKKQPDFYETGAVLSARQSVAPETLMRAMPQPDAETAMTGAVPRERMEDGVPRMVGQEKQRAGDQAIEEEAVPAPAALEADAGVPAAASFGAPEADEGLAQVGQEKQRAGDQAIEEEAVPAPAALEADAGVPAAASFGAPEADEGLAQETAGGEAFSEADGGPISPAAARISPAAGPGSSYPGTAAGQDYKKRLRELDAQIQKIREEGSANVYSFKVSAETELSMWENEMNTVYGALEELLDEEDKQELKEEQQEWIKTRDKNAAKAAKNGASVETVGYAAELVSLTRDRAYELAEEYEEEAEEREEEAQQAG